MNKIFLFLCAALIVSCSHQKEKPTFSEWYNEFSDIKLASFDSSKIRTKIISSDLFKIDTIYKSMMGPSSEQIIQLADSGDLLWLIGYEVKVLDSAGKHKLSPEFMCHNNLNLTSQRIFPWQADVFAYTNRIFTLTQGFTQLKLPAGFGIPFPSSQNFKAIFQALNHNNPNLNTSLKHEIKLKYLLESEIDFEMKALSQNTVWLIKQYDGPKGVYGEKPENNNAIENKLVYHPSQQPSCGVDMLANNPMKKLDLYYDSYGRKFTGHWKIVPGKEKLSFKATKMMNLKKDKTLYYATAHVHPYCEYLELRDLTENKLIFKTTTKGIVGKIGLEFISDFTSKEGVVLFKDHDYELVSFYNNTGKDTLSAMSVVYLYLEY